MTRRWLRYVHALLIASLTAGATGCATTSASSWDEPFFFIQLADPQFGMFAKNASFEKETERMEKAVAHANRLKPAFVVICGDLTNKVGDPAQIAELLRITGQLDKTINLYLVSGNHDVDNVPTAQTLERYRQTYGADWYAFTTGSCRFIVINTTIMHRPEHVEAEMDRQRVWLEQELADARDGGFAHTIVLQHHPYFLTQPDEENAYANIPMPRRQEYLNLLMDAGVTAVFAGHTHKNCEARFGEMEMIASGPVGQPHGKDPSGLRIVKVYRDRIEHTYYGLDAVPERVVLKPER